MKNPTSVDQAGGAGEGLRMLVNAGVIEGFFGRPWDWAARIDGVAFLREAGYRFYIYAPKSESFLRRRWAEPLPAGTVEALAQLAAACRAAGIAFGVGLTPFEVHLDPGPRSREALRSKVRQLNELGVELLCILFDDMRGDVPGLADIQAQVSAEICAHSTAGRFVVCPTYYSCDDVLVREFGPRPAGYLKDLGRALDPAIDLFWTGPKVISAGYPAGHLAQVAQEMGRKPFIWDNHIANDSRLRTDHLFLDPTLDSWALQTDLVAGFAVNPMNQPYLSRIALCGYRELLGGGLRGAASLRAACTALGGAAFAAQVAADFEQLQIAGLGGLDTAARERLRERYESVPDNPYAREIAAWLRGEYAFDPACLTD